MHPRSHRALAAARPALLALAIGLPLPAAPVRAERPIEACRAACEARNVAASCAWLSTNARRCLRSSLRACKDAVAAGAPASCPLPPDLPACLTNQSCPHGALCVDATCQVVACEGADGFSNCTGRQQCVEGRCIVAECEGSSQNCPAAHACVSTGFLTSVCAPNDPTRTACMTNTDCIAAGSFNPRCMRGVCAAKKRRQGCTSDGDCFDACKASRAAVRIPRCDAAGRCVCANCVSDSQCDARFGCADDQDPFCRGNGTCFCPPPAGSGGRGVCTTFETPACTPCRTDADCGGFDVCLQSASCMRIGP